MQACGQIWALHYVDQANWRVPITEGGSEHAVTRTAPCSQGLRPVMHRFPLRSWPTC